MRLLPVGPDHVGDRAVVRTSPPDDSDIDAAMANICRCGTYPRMRAAVHRAAELTKI